MDYKISVFGEGKRLSWDKPDKLSFPVSYQCGFCKTHVSSDRGLTSTQGTAYVLVCPNCTKPTFWTTDGQIPQAINAVDFKHLPPQVENIYREARLSFQAGAFTGVVTLCRTLLGHVAVNLSAKTGETFQYYVQWLSDENYIPKNSTGWVDLIRKMGNATVHDLEISPKSDAELILEFTEMILTLVYENQGKLHTRTQQIQTP